MARISRRATISDMPTLVRAATPNGLAVGEQASCLDDFAEIGSVGDVVQLRPPRDTHGATIYPELRTGAPMRSSRWHRGGPARCSWSRAANAKNPEADAHSSRTFSARPSVQINHDCEQRSHRNTQLGTVVA